MKKMPLIADDSELIRTSLLWLLKVIAGIQVIDTPGTIGYFVSSS